MYLAVSFDSLLIVGLVLGAVALVVGYTFLVVHLERRRRDRLTELLQQEHFHIHYQPPSRFGRRRIATDPEQDRVFERLKLVAQRLQELAYQKMPIKPRRGFIGPECVRFSARSERDGTRTEYVEFEIIMEPTGRGMNIWHYYSIVLITPEDRSTHLSPSTFEQPLAPAIKDWSKRKGLVVKEFFVAGIRYVACREWLDPRETLEFIRTAKNQPQAS